MKTGLYCPPLTVIFLMILTQCRSGVQSKLREEAHSEMIRNPLRNMLASDSTGGKRIIFMIRFKDFGCQPCLRNFFEICDSVATIRKYSRSLRVSLLFLREQSDTAFQLMRMKSWAHSSGLSYPVALATADIFRYYRIERSGILILEDDGTVDFTGEIPISPDDLSQILRAIKE